MERSTGDQLLLFPESISADLTSVISSPVLAAGRMRCVSPAGRKAVRCGPALVRASRSAAPAGAEGLPMSGIFGPPGCGSSASIALARSLASRLQARLDGRGSTLFSLTWKESATPAGRSFSLLRASVRRMVDTGFSSWPTPQANNALRGGSIQRAFNPARSQDLHDHVLTVSSARARLTASGEMLSGCEAATTAGGQLSPRHSRWLIGLPRTWDDCAPTATRSSRKLQPSSSALILI